MELQDHAATAATITVALIGRDGLAELSPETRARLDAVLPPTWSKANPVDIVGDADAARDPAALAALLADKANDAVLVLNVPTGPDS